MTGRRIRIGTSGWHYPGGYQQFTHPKMFAAATGNSKDVEADRGDVDRFRDAVAPLHEAGKLGALLAQFPASFKNAAAAHDHLAWLDPYRGIRILSPAAVLELLNRRETVGDA